MGFLPSPEWGSPMDRPLVGRCVLVIEDEALIACDVKTGLEDAGAKVVLACSAAEALKVVEEANLSAAVVDPSLDDCDNSEVHARLRQRNIPFVTYSALSEAES